MLSKDHQVRTDAARSPSLPGWLRPLQGAKPGLAFGPAPAHLCPSVKRPQVHNGPCSRDLKFSLSTSLFTWSGTPLPTKSLDLIPIHSLKISTQSPSCRKLSPIPCYQETVIACLLELSLCIPPARPCVL